MQYFHRQLLTDKVNKRWFQLLIELERERTVSTKDLAKSVSSTTRTIISDIANIRTYFGKAIRIDVTNMGYSFFEIDSEEYIRKKKELLDLEPLFVIITAIFNNELLSIGEWSDRLHKSESTILRNLKKLDKIVADYQFEIEYSPITFKGKEQNIRKFFLSFFYEADATPHTVTPNIMIQEIVLEFSKAYHLETHLAIQFSMFCYILLISLERSQGGHHIKLPQKLKRELLKYHENFDLQKLKGIILRKTGEALSDEELLYIKLFLITNRNIDSLKSEGEFVKRYANDRVNQLAQAYLQLHPEITRNGVEALIHSFFTCCYLEIQLTEVHVKNLCGGTLFDEGPDASNFAQNLSFLERHPLAQQFLTERIVRDVAVNLTLLMSAIESSYYSSSLKIAFLLEGNHFVCLQTKAFAHQLLAGSHQLYFLDSISLNEDILETIGVDIIVTNYSEYINDYVLKSEYLLFQTIPTADDWNSLLKKISPALTKTSARSALI
ncbi:helix-turn-helix domain-containing protein [Vagococcus sp. BWB3-3]|uniref:Helix-turn-helix domain-containing protein n=1 Tax=Vagococcus allomyrinae TaxID=2794353 RepID=A0A940PG84_9ENTE|nr:helix-turn-helix domain-containing protein [Vagococcus allomyrinae]MBP1044305.1 helix-turn-helix domain-containing protein [Vagococcus allomyrinae]